MPPSSDHPSLNLILFDEPFVVYKIAAHEELPEEILKAVTQNVGSKDLISMTRTSEEISIVLRADRLPNVGSDTPRWRCIKFNGPLYYELTGILCDAAIPLKQASISIFAISTWNTDYVLVPDAKAEAAVRVLENDGWKFTKIGNPVA